MPWWAWASIVVYAAVWRLTFRLVWEDHPESNWLIFWQCVVATTFLFWLAWLILLLGKSSARLEPDQVARVVGGESRAHKRQRRERELRELAARVQVAEKELGIDGEGV